MDRTLITRHKGDYLRGSFFLSGRDGAFATRDPATGITLDEVPYRRAAVDDAVDDARSAADAWGRTPLPQRLRRVHALRDILAERQGLLGALASREMGKPLWECELECAAAVRALDLLMEQAEDLLGPTPHPAVPGVLRRRPVGVVAATTPFPFPVYGTMQVVLPCLLAGNAVVWKPSSRVPLISQRVADAFDAARFPHGAFAMVQGPRNPIGRALLNHDGIDMLAVAGSSDLADVARAADKRVWTQAGGKGWALVADDADLDRAAYEIVTSAFLSTGQRCNATARVMVEKAVARPLLKRVVALTSGLEIGAPSGDVFCGPLVDIGARRRFHAALKQYAEAGIEFPVEGGGGQLPAKLRRRGQCYVAPAIALVEGELPEGITPPEEVEGPLLVAHLVDDIEDAAQAYNAHPYGMAAAVFCGRRARFESIARSLRAGAVNWNRGTIVASARFPNAGLKRSGRGSEGNAALLLAATTSQSTLMGSGRFDPRHRVPGMAWPESMGTLEAVDATTPPYPGVAPGSPAIVDPHRVSTGRMPAIVLPPDKG